MPRGQPKKKKLILSVKPSCSEVAWDLGPGPFAAVLEPGQTSPKKLQETENNCVHEQLREIMDKIQKDFKKPTATSEEPRAKAGTTQAPCTGHHQRGGQTA